METMANQLIDKLKESPQKEYKIVVMPHFCIDNLIQVGGEFDSFKKKSENIINKGGGNLSIKQIQQLGGKAANFSNALASLGMPSYLIARTNDMGYILLENLLEGKDVDISHVKRDGDLAFTSSIELESANIMISDPGSLAQFGHENLTEEDEELIMTADFVCISDWGLNEMGTELANYVFRLVKEEGQGKTFFDPGDPSPKGANMDNEIKEMIKDVIGAGLVDILSINLGEAELLGGLDFLRTNTRVDLHTKDFSRSFFGFTESARAPSFSVTPKRLTGAGDAWNAADAYAEILGFSYEMRLLFANAEAACYISDPQGRHPSIEDIVVFLENNSVME
jgi:ribokinase